jgi:hypothetical protein
MKNAAIVYFSAAGHTQQLAHAIAEGFRSVPQTTARLVGQPIADATHRWQRT